MRMEHNVDRETKILNAASEVLLCNPFAPMSAIASSAGVGMSAMYLRFANKELLLQAIAVRNLRNFIDVTERNLAEKRDPTHTLVSWLHELLEADTLRLGSTLAGTFAATPELEELAAKASGLTKRMVERMHDEGVLRPGIVSHDLELIVEAIGAVRIGEGHRQGEIRARLLTLALNGLLVDIQNMEPAQAPTTSEMTARWRYIPTSRD